MDSDLQAIKFVRDRKAYTLVEKIGLSEDGVTTFRATYFPPTCNKEHNVRIKIFELRRMQDIYELTNEIYNAELCCHHQNIEGVYCSFKVENTLWVVMPWSNGDPLMLSPYRDGLSNRKIAYVLKQILEAVDCIHSHHDHVHGNVDPCHVFVDTNLNVKLKFNSFIDSVTNVDETRSWKIDPALTANLHKPHDQKSDIWMIGVLALELFYGVHDHEVLEYAVATISSNPKREAKHGHGFLQKISCFGGDLIKKKLPESLRELVGLCLSLDPSKRPSTRELLGHKYFEGY